MKFTDILVWVKTNFSLLYERVHVQDRIFCAKNTFGVRVNFSAHSASITTIFWNDIHKYIDYNVLIFHNDCSKADGDNEVYLRSRLPTTQILPPPSFQQKSRPYIANKNHTKKDLAGPSLRNEMYWMLGAYETYHAYVILVEVHCDTPSSQINVPSGFLCLFFFFCQISITKMLVKSLFVNGFLKFKRLWKAENKIYPYALSQMTYKTY